MSAEWTIEIFYKYNVIVINNSKYLGKIIIIFEYIFFSLDIIKLNKYVFNICI